MGATLRRAARATAYLLTSAAMAFGLYLFTTVLLLTAAGTLLVVGAWMLPETVLLIRRIAGAKRQMVGAWDGAPIEEVYRPLHGRVAERVRTATRDPATRTDLRWIAATWFYPVPLFLTALLLWPLGLVIDAVAAGVLRRRPLVVPLISRLADAEATWSRRLLRPSKAARLSARVDELAATRADAIAAHGAELRRIERDLHDGTQARLVAMHMRIGMALQIYDNDAAAGRDLLEQARDQAEASLRELRHVVRGIHPPILTDRGLAGAVRALAADSGLQVEVRVDGLEDERTRPAAALEAAVYFTVSEALTNAAKHSTAKRASVRLERLPAGIRAVVSDEGIGGAQETSGSGLAGVRRRTAALDGTLTLSSPPGGPTVIEVELPCVW
ncbi:histidine kinase [Streptomyces sp. NPDC094034]|uniref:sensor histidine kinase n=1 Tax=Streptomyces sp. NPDC094034 TaxID=3155309 RepID=UPI00331E8CB6